MGDLTSQKPTVVVTGMFSIMLHSCWQKKIRVRDMMSVTNSLIIN